MNMNQKKQKLNKGISIAVAILLALTLCVTIIAFAVSKRTKPSDITTTPLKTTGNIVSTTKKPISTTTPPTITDEEPSSPTGADEVSFICPVSGTLIKNYSADIPVFSLTMEDYRVHCGVDISADAGTKVLAAANGTVSKVYFDPMMGQTIEISHSGGYVTIYKNLQTNIPAGIEEGKTVAAGDLIGYVGDTALVEISDSPHLHLEMNKNGESADPLSHIKLDSVDTSADYED